MSLPAWVVWRIYRYGGVWAWAARSSQGRMGAEGFPTEDEARDDLIRSLRTLATWED